MEERKVERRVLSIQSHVVSGYVGNKSATFPLQVLGFEVDNINSVQFSNHTGYKHIKGQILHDTELADLYSGLKSNGINNYSHLLTGYTGSPSFLENICEVVIDLKQKNPDIIYVCDPVMGDNGKMYVPETLLPIYKEKVLPLADIIVPNQFEAELLTGIKINDLEDAQKAILHFHEKGINTVVISSTALGCSNMLLLLGSCMLDGKQHQIRMDIPQLPVNFTGTGDLFAALLLAWMDFHENDLKTSIEKVIATMQATLQRTLNEAQKLAGAGNQLNVCHLELKLVQSKCDIENPNVVIKAEQIS
ncbi:pyridoxal kinase-like [Tubulanus polymorphus]|uniref:pyridoxal kinase-like n=1 Tax=Tubulanus polymorphus TaxID=672921 RepID=UPI003DA21E75